MSESVESINEATIKDFEMTEDHHESAEDANNMSTEAADGLMLVDIAGYVGTFISLLYICVLIHYSIGSLFDSFVVMYTHMQIICTYLRPC